MIQYFLIIQSDHITVKLLIFAPGNIYANDVANLLYKDTDTEYGKFRKLKSDNTNIIRLWKYFNDSLIKIRSNNVSEFYRAIIEVLKLTRNVNHKLSITYHPMISGISKGGHQSLITVLRKRSTTARCQDHPNTALWIDRIIIQ
ncbi:uncharacterized protein KGF55_005153 [Candida pseudojiufengensis]|uniref:uncharacterized protein n=1 Tax=Candida pseudojiufengensis TaxID=497109 RepID=UPI002224412E|nr:uncharacterized protein KGF55_005153 [Candida pseudojiufengensis]KAI5959921.1 hypothetical protein KGF55_005153 [Candida pseudojiufengensis]